ncbi:ras-related protein Rab-28-like [Maniola jurtina]|uniref:ras-related protein Rab-28-like n=1 Tax=Maniola jurtina TaxID=191418 RepID=UPI001E68F8E2|nr:ras-related protein Rab-28-like [Maniola jurtina]
MSDTEEEENSGKVTKITLVGEPLTGKSSICNRYVGGSGVSWGGTQGAEVSAAQWAGATPPAALQLCDVAGAALATAMLPNYLYASDIVIFVYDLTNLQSFEKLDMWMKSIKDIFESEPKKPLMALFGNKSDLEHQRAVRLSCVQKFSSEHLLENFKGSAKTGEMVNTAFSKLIARVLGVKMPVEVAAHRKSTDTQISETNGQPHLPSNDATNTLIMNRKMLRKIQRKASSSVCCIQ